MSEYVTVVSVDLHQPKLVQLSSNNNININHNNNAISDSNHDKKSSFVTVLSINNNNNQNTTTISTTESPTNGEIVTVYRLPGERLGFGLKFQGGTKTNEKVERLFIQSCDADTPAAKAKTSWGRLSEGDEILQIDREPITKMTRIECVKCLKDRNVAINLLVKKGDRDSMSIVRNDTVLVAKRPPPPPKIPPRKIHKKPPPPVINNNNNNFQVPTATTIVHQPKAMIIAETPVAAEMYLNCTLDDNTRNDESDETGSTISSQISVISNFSSESDLSLLSTTSDRTRMLSKPFQMIEREFNVNSGSMSLDNLMLFNESEPSSDHDDIKAINSNSIINDNNNYVNIAVTKTTTTIDSVVDDQIQYENVDIKVPPVPRPRSISISLPPEAAHCEIIETTPTNTTIESWLNDAKAINGSVAADKSNGLRVDETETQTYEPIKFECFAASDDDCDEKLGPSAELLNISEAYFNFPWCGNSNHSLPTIGEAEEEFSSIEQHFTTQKIING